MKFRNLFVMITAALISLTLIVESMSIAKDSGNFLQILQRFSILGLMLFFLISNFEIKSGFFFWETLPEASSRRIETLLQPRCTFG